MDRKDTMKMTMTTGIILGVTGAISGTPIGNAVSGAGLIMIALSILLFPDALVELIYDYMGGGYEDPEETSRDRGRGA